MSYVTKNARHVFALWVIYLFQQTMIYLKCLPVTSDTPFPETYKLFFKKKSKMSALSDILILSATKIIIFHAGVYMGI